MNRKLTYLGVAVMLLALLQFSYNHEANMQDTVQVNQSFASMLEDEICYHCVASTEPCEGEGTQGSSGTPYGDYNEFDCDDVRLE